MQNRTPEILSPAGNPEKLRFAVNYGADAVYCALKEFGMRAAADNFTLEELDDALKFVHERGKRLYLTLNTLPTDNEIPRLEEILRELASVTPDAFIVADLGVMELIKKHIPDAVIHLSTQASTVNSYGCRFWHDYGVKRIVLARELTLENVKTLRQKIPADLELEAFVHGAMCIAYSGRCILSSYFTGRSGNNGRCTQPCRWKYFIHEEKRPDDVISAEQDANGTYIFSGKDMCMIEHIPDLLEAGIDSFKIEGRMKSAYYTACVTNAYKLALRDAQSGKPFNPACMDELNGVSHREYCTGFWYSSPHEQANIVGKNEYLCEKAFLATVTEYDPVTGLAKCFQRNKMFGNSDVQLLSPGKLGRTVHVSGLYDIEMNPIDSTPHPCMEFYMKVDSALPGDIIRGC